MKHRRSTDVIPQRRGTAPGAKAGAGAGGLDLALLRYREGIGNYLQVLSAEQPLLVQQSLDADLRAQQLDLAINLVHALGGGFAEPALH